MVNKNQDLINRLRKVADYLASNPEIPECSYTDYANRLDVFRLNNWTPADVVRKFGAMDKVVVPGSDLFILKKKLDGFTLEFNFNRETVCTKIKVGEVVIPAKEAYTVPATPEKIVEKFEWECPESILRNEEDDPVSQEKMEDALGIGTPIQ